MTTSQRPAYSAPDQQHANPSAAPIRAPAWLIAIRWLKCQIHHAQSQIPMGQNSKPRVDHFRCRESRAIRPFGRGQFRAIPPLCRFTCPLQGPRRNPGIPSPTKCKNPELCRGDQRKRQGSRMIPSPKATSLIPTSPRARPERLHRLARRTQRVAGRIDRHHQSTQIGLDIPQ